MMSCRQGGLWAAAILLVAPIGIAGQEPPSEVFQPFSERAFRLVNSIAFSPGDNEMYITLFAREAREQLGLPT